MQLQINSKLISRLEFLRNISGNRFALSNAEANHINQSRASRFTFIENTAWAISKMENQKHGLLFGNGNVFGNLQQISN